MASVILASSSNIRAKLLQDAGVPFCIVPAKIDETAIIASLVADNAKPHEIADTLAEYKAARIGSKYTDKLVIGCDQILVCEKQIYEKAPTQAEARKKLLSLRGKAHQLLSAVVIFEEGRPVWRHIGRAQLVMRDFSDDYLAEYIQNNENEMLSSVGCYKIEGPGAQLFTHIQGDYFTILGIPLLEVLGFLRKRGVLLV